MEVVRLLWQNRLEESWKKRPIVWLAGVRRVGKTTLARALANSTLVNCDLPSTQRRLEDPESFYENLKTKRIIFDEIHQLHDPALVLKIGADQYSNHQILATGSSTLLATKKFSDSLTDRKRIVHLVPILPEELTSFGKFDIKTRMFRGGLPPALLAEEYDHEFYAEWLDSFYARDVQELYSVDKRQPFLKVLEYLLIENAHQIEVTSIGKYAGLSRPTVVRYLEILENTKAISLVRPFAKNLAHSLVQQPKVYGFDTGFSAYAKGWSELRDTDCGQFLENLTLETLQSLPGVRPFYYWRTKQGREIDFILPESNNVVHTIECKWKSDGFVPDHVKVFRETHRLGRNFVVASNVGSAGFSKKYGAIKVEFVDIKQLRSVLGAVLKK